MCSAAEALKEYEETVKEYFRINGVTENDLEAFFQEMLVEERTSEKLAAIMIGDTLINGGRGLNFQFKFKQFCDLTGGWSSSLKAMFDLISRKRAVSTELASQSSSSAYLPNEVVFWMNIPHQGPSFNINHLLILRAQSLGGCYLHCAVTVEHYLVCLSSKLRDLRMLNMGQWERNKACADASELRKFLRQEYGKSDVELKDMLGLSFREVRSISFIEELAETIYKTVAKRPMLLTRMEIYQEFLQEGKLSYSIADRGCENHCDAYQSMVVIGARRDNSPEDGGYYFLIQNSWKNKFFVECSFAYLASCDAILLDVINGEITSTRNTSIDSTMFVIAEYAESALDIAEDPCESD